MSQENVEVIRGLFEATNQGDRERALAAFADNVELLVVHESPGGRYRGIAEVGAWYADWFATFEPGYSFHVEEILEKDDAVVVLATHHGRGKLSGVQIEQSNANAFWMKEGKVVRIALYPERAEALEAVGLAE